ncbi:MAG: hypothetical protein ACLPV8_17610 [Steroidobacteraceae bacterium]
MTGGGTDVECAVTGAVNASWRIRSGSDKPNNPGYVQAALELSRIGTLIMVDNVVREGSVVSAKHDVAAQGVRRMAAWIGADSRLSATVIQTVGNKGYDGFLLARVQSRSEA